MKLGDRLESWGSKKSSLQEVILELQDILGKMEGEQDCITNKRAEQVQRPWGRIQLGKSED